MFIKTVAKVVMALLIVVVIANEVSALSEAVPHVRAEYIWGQGYTGSGVEIGVIDLYQGDSSHPALSGNYLGSEKFVNGAGWIGSHATAVAGVAVSQDATDRGVAFGAGWWTAQTTNRGTRTTTRAQIKAAETFGQGLSGLNGNPAEVITLSIGFAGTTEGSDQWTLALDHIAASNGTTVTISAGNNGPNSSTLSGPPSGAYNAIVVGATGADANGNASRDFTNVVYFSSRGTTTDGRYKPDIVAPVTLLQLPTSGGGWTTASGTSFATPIVAGGTGLLIDAGSDMGMDTDSTVIKSVLLNSADKLDNWSHSSTQPLDLSQGAGQMNLKNAYQQYVAGEQSVGLVDGVGWDRSVASTSSQSIYDLDMDVPIGSTIVATLTWNRNVSTSSEDLDLVVYSANALNNLDLFLYAQNDLSAAMVSSVSVIDNVEHLYFTDAPAGRYSVGVEMEDLGISVSEGYSLAWRVIERLTADANNDDKVDLIDLDILGQSFGDVCSEGPNCGDFDGDGSVGLLDLNLLGLYFGTDNTLSIPEPYCLSVLIIGGVVGCSRRGRFC